MASIVDLLYALFAMAKNEEVVHQTLRHVFLQITSTDDDNPWMSVNDIVECTFILMASTNDMLLFLLIVPAYSSLPFECFCFSSWEKK